MNKYLIRFNKSRGQPGRGSLQHVWRVFENDDEYIVKNVVINVNSRSETTGDGHGNDDWNITCQGYMTVDEKTGTATINKTKPVK
jgi:hypothetical protein